MPRGPSSGSAAASRSFSGNALGNSRGLYKASEWRGTARLSAARQARRVTPARSALAGHAPAARNLHDPARGQIYFTAQ
eukprot:8831982-Pyramimonas_sp.AAC.1